MPTNISDQSSDAPLTADPSAAKRLRVAGVRVAGTETRTTDTESNRQDIELAAMLADAEGIELDAVVDAVDEIDHLDEVDCIVCAVSTDGGSPDDVLDVLTAVRDRAPSMPVVLTTAAADPVVPAQFVAAKWTDTVLTGTPGQDQRLRDRIQRIVTHQRNEERAEQATTAVEAARDGIAVVTADGEIGLANRSFARQFASTPGELREKPWEALFADSAAERIETEALAAVADGWEWLGTCTGSRLDGGPVRLQVRVAGVEDGGFVLAVSRPQSDAAESRELAGTETTDQTDAGAEDPATESANVADVDDSND